MSCEVQWNKHTLHIPGCPRDPGCARSMPTWCCCWGRTRTGPCPARPRRPLWQCRPSCGRLQTGTGRADRRVLIDCHYFKTTFTPIKSMVSVSAQGSQSNYISPGDWLWCGGSGQNTINERGGRKQWLTCYSFCRLFIELHILVRL